MKRFVAIGALAAAVIALHLLFAAAGAEYLLVQLTMAAYYALVVIGLCLLMGYAGQISLGHAAFFALGGYTAAVLSTNSFTQLMGAPALERLVHWGLVTAGTDAYGAAAHQVPVWLSLPLAVAAAAAVALVIGIPVLKLKGHYLAMATLGFGTILYRIFLGTRLFGEADGISSVRPCALLPGLTIGGDTALRTQNYYFAWALVLLAMVLSLNIVSSRAGRALRSIHGSEEAAAAMGVNTARYKLYVFILSAVFAAVGGFFMTHFNGGIGPAEAGIMKSVRYVAIVAVGGMANLWGSLLIGVLLNFLSLRGIFGSYDDAVFGALLVFIMALAPDGILRREFLHRIMRVRIRWPFSK
ncbi:MAG: branched-chain amino acid ABC transporter permease [Spirochaetes bacterium]|nr:branched-chain amino acid ABC transporter permease [Spirochaetota bacterium]